MAKKHKKNPMAGLKRPRWKLRKVDGFAIRNRYPDWDVMETSDSMPSVRPGEALIDKCFWKERELLLNVHWHERALSERGWTNKEVREYIKQHLTKSGPIPNFIVKSRRQGKLTIRWVRGNIVRAYIDPQFVFGGHDKVYKYIPDNEVWLDVLQDKREIPYVLFHEKRERKEMMRGASYEQAHKIATEAEKKLRRQELRKLRPLNIKGFGQGPAMCGPASLRIAANYSDRQYSEEELAKLCGSTAEAGTEHEGMVAGAKAIGANVVAKENGSLATLRYYIHRQRLPVIVGWWMNPKCSAKEAQNDHSLDEGHYSVVYHLDNRYVYLVDPVAKNYRRKMPIKQFLNQWWDLDTPRYVKSDRWYMVISF